MGKEPSLTQWRKLYQEARRFWKLAPWEWMSDSMLFGVQDPRTGEVWYCIVLGQGGEVMGLVAYPGRAGLDSYFAVWREDPDEPSWDLIASQLCLKLTFEGREALTPRDRAVIRRLGLKSQGPGSWPLFRSLRPGYEPWYLDADEVRFFTLALAQAREVAVWARENPGEMEINLEADDAVLVRVPRDKEGREWESEWQPLPAPAPLPRSEPLCPEELSRLRELQKPRHGVWEVDVFAVPALIREGEDEPGLFMAGRLCIQQESGLIVGTDVVEYAHRFSGLTSWLAEVLEESRWGWPQEVWVWRPEMLPFLAPLLWELGIDLVLAAGLPALEEAKESLIAWLKEGKR